MAKDAVGGVVRTRPSASMVPIKPPPRSGAVKLVKKATERLEEDAKEMESRLVQLRLSMLEEKKKRDKELPAKHGGNRWRSACEDRGSVSNYAQDVQNKAKPSTKKASTEPKPRTAKKTKNKTRKGENDKPSLGILSAVTAPQWTTCQVLEWLGAIGLDEYQSGFEYHQVTGATLLALTLDELTQIGVVKLSARNTLYTEIEKIRDQRLAPGSVPDSGSQMQRHHQQPAEIIDSKLHDVSPEVHSSQSKNGGDSGVHWSQVKPLSEMAVALGNGNVPVNLADGDFNEDESHASFMKALLEWRSTDSDQAHGDETDVVAGDKEGLWVNPMRSMFQDDVPTGGVLLDGSYDEEKEQEAFRRAVEAWRAGASTSSALPTTPSVAQMEQGCTTMQRKSCWQCYQVVNVDSLTVDAQTSKPFCSAACQSVYHHEYARFYQKQ